MNRTQRVSRVTCGVVVQGDRDGSGEPAEAVPQHVSSKIECKLAASSREGEAAVSPVCRECEDDEAGTYVCEPCKAAALILDRCSYCGREASQTIECADAEEVERMRRFAVCDRESCYFEARNL